MHDRAVTRATPTRRHAVHPVAAAALLTVVVTAGCFADVAPGEPPDPNAAAMFREVNATRASYGLAPLAYSPKLTNLAGTWAWQMSVDNWMRHQNLGGLLCCDPAFGAYVALGENLAVGSPGTSPRQVVLTMMASGPHRANILSASYNVMGVGLIFGGDGRVWVAVDFGAL